MHTRCPARTSSADSGRMRSATRTEALSPPPPPPARPLGGVGVGASGRMSSPGAIAVDLALSRRGDTATSAAVGSGDCRNQAVWATTAPVPARAAAHATQISLADSLRSPCSSHSAVSSLLSLSFPLLISLSLCLVSLSLSLSLSSSYVWRRWRFRVWGLSVFDRGRGHSDARRRGHDALGDRGHSDARRRGHAVLGDRVTSHVVWRALVFVGLRSSRLSPFSPFSLSSAAFSRFAPSASSSPS